MNVIIANRQRVKRINTALLKKITAAALAELKIEHCELEISLLDSREMALLNETFLQHEGSTDVITFDYCEGKKLREVGVSGEIFVCVDDAIQQSRQFKTNWQSEVTRYIVHGILHLLRYDDLEPELRRTMKRRENLVVRMLSKRFSLAEISSAT